VQRASRRRVEEALMERDPNRHQPTTQQRGSTPPQQPLQSIDCPRPAAASSRPQPSLHSIQSMCGARLLGRNRSRSIVRVRTRSNDDDGPPILPTDNNFQLTAQLTLPPSLHKPRLRPNLKNMRVIALLALLAAPAVAFVPFTIKVRPVSLGVRNIRGRRGLQHMRRIGLLRPRARQQWQEGVQVPAIKWKD